MSDFTKLPDGRLLFKRCNPPKSVPGYFRDRTNPNVFIPDYTNCPHRTVKTIQKYCPRSRAMKSVCVDYCQHFNKEVFPEVCNACEVPDLQESESKDSGGSASGSEGQS